MAPKLQDQDGISQASLDSPCSISAAYSPLAAHNLRDPSVDAFPLSPLSRPSSSPNHSQHHRRLASDSSSVSFHLDLGSCGNLDSAALPCTSAGQGFSVSPTMAQPTISRHPTHDAWANRLEQRAEHYNYHASHAAPLTPPPQPIKHSSPPMRPTGTQGHHAYHHGVSTPANYALNQSSTPQDQFAPYQRSSPTPVSPSFNDFSMDSIVTSPQVEQAQSWPVSSMSSFDHTLGPTHAHQSQQQLPPFDESKVQPWWPPASGGAVPAQNHYAARTHRQTSAPAMPPSQTQYGGYYSAPTHSSGLMINCQPGANEIQPPSMHHGAGQYATSAPAHASMAPYQRQPSMPHLQSGSRRASQIASSGHSTANSSASSSRRASRSQTQPHRRSKSSASPPRAAGRDNGSSGSVGFVNFTPNDSKRILTGVAPSGSSKTKARREKEAREKRKQLNEAAQRAVMEAGGDPMALERSGLFAS